MSDHLHIEKGCTPHQPSEATELLNVYHEFTIPLVGLIEQQGVPYLFFCVVGHAGPQSAWAYARLDNTAAAEPLAKADNETFDDVLAETVRGRVCTFAVAGDETGIIEWVSIDPPADVPTAYQRGMEELSAKVNEAMAEMNELMERFPSIQSASSFSISPSPVKATTSRSA